MRIVSNSYILNTLISRQIPSLSPSRIISKPPPNLYPSLPQNELEEKTRSTYAISPIISKLYRRQSVLDVYHTRINTLTKSN